MSTQRYFNVPIQLLQGLLINKHSTLNNITHHAVFEYCYNQDEDVNEAEKFFGITLRNKDYAMKTGKVLWDSLPDGSPKVGINVHKLFEFLKEDKSEFELVCFLAYLALKSIIQKKAYCKIDNLYLLSRMDGKTKKVSSPEYLSKEISKYNSEYQMVKIKRALILSWGLSTYSRYTRGFYVSFQLTLEDLIFYAEKQRKSYKEKQLKQKQKMAYQSAMERISNLRP